MASPCCTGDVSITVWGWPLLRPIVVSSSTGMPPARHPRRPKLTFKTTRWKVFSALSCKSVGTPEQYVPPESSIPPPAPRQSLDLPPVTFRRSRPVGIGAQRSRRPAFCDRTLAFGDRLGGLRVEGRGGRGPTLACSATARTTTVQRRSPIRTSTTSAGRTSFAGLISLAVQCVPGRRGTASVAAARVLKNRAAHSHLSMRIPTWSSPSHGRRSRH